MKRSRIAASAIALALVGASALVMTSPALAVANVPNLLNTGGTTTLTTPLIQGDYDNSTGDEVDIHVEVSNGGPYTPYCIDSILASETSAAEFWVCSGTALPYGDYTFRSYAFDTLNALQSGYSTTTSFQIGGPEVAAIATPTPGQNTSDATVAFAGTGPARGSVVVFDTVIGTLCSSAVDAAGNWACTTIPIPDGARTVYAIGQTIDFDPGLQSVTPDQLLQLNPPPPPSVDPYPFVASGEGSPSVQGNMALDVGQILVYSSPDNLTWSLYCQVFTNPLATVWFCPSPSGSLPIGTNYIAATADTEYTAGTPSAFSPSITIDVVPPPLPVSPADGAYTNDSTPTFSGTSVYGANFTVRLISPSVAVCGGVVAANAWSCTAGVISDGTYQWFTNIQPGNGISSVARTLTIDTVAPSIPVITEPGMTTTNTRPVLRGTAEPGALVQIYRDGALAGCQEGAVYADGSGQWRCTSSATLTVGATYGFGAVQADLAGNLSSLGLPPVTLSLTILATPVAPTPTPTPAAPLPWTFAFGVGGTEFAPGDSTQLNATGLPPGAEVDVEFHSTPVKVGSTVVEADGSFSMDVQIPDDAEVGPHKFVVTVTPLDGLPSVQEQPVTVRIPPKQAVESDHVQPFVAPPGATGSERNDPGAPSSLTNSLETAQSIFSNPVVIGGAAIAGLALLLLVAFPAELLNSTISEQYERLTKNIPRARVPWWTRFSAWFASRPLVGGTIMILTAAVIFGFADPGFGFDITSLRVVLACALAIFVVGYLSSAATGAIVRRAWGLATTMELMPFALILTVVGVVLSRLLDFSPGFLLGLLMGVSLVGRSTAGQRAKTAVLLVGMIFSFALVAWLIYSALSATVEPDNFATTLLFDTLVAITAEGLTGLFVGLLPFKYFLGSAIFGYSKLLWGLVYAFASLVFVLIVLPASWGDPDGSLGTWLLVLGGFAAVALGVYLYFRFWAPRDESDGDSDDEDDAPEKHPELTAH